jgi:Flp pilus assembly protein TadG
MKHRRQRGTTTIEFAIIGMVLLTMMLAVVEFGRLLFTFSVLSEGTRRGARVAAVCPINDPAISDAVLFASLPGLTPAHVSIAYLDQNGVAIANPGAAAAFNTIRYVRVWINGYTHQMAIPVILPTLSMPFFTTTLPSESLGNVGTVSTPC